MVTVSTMNHVFKNIELGFHSDVKEAKIAKVRDTGCCLIVKTSLVYVKIHYRFKIRSQGRYIFSPPPTTPSPPRLRYRLFGKCGGIYARPSTRNAKTMYAVRSSNCQIYKQRSNRKVRQPTL